MSYKAFRIDLRHFKAGKQDYIQNKKKQEENGSFDRYYKR